MLKKFFLNKATEENFDYFLSESIPFIEDKIGYVFGDKTIIAVAFTHRTFANEHPELLASVIQKFDNNILSNLSSDPSSFCPSLAKFYNLTYNERLSFIGEVILDYIIRDYLFIELRDEVYEKKKKLSAENNNNEKIIGNSRGEMSQVRNRLVDTFACANYIRMLNLERLLLVGKGERASLFSNTNNNNLSIFPKIDNNFNSNNLSTFDAGVFPSSSSSLFPQQQPQQVSQLSPLPKGKETIFCELFLALIGAIYLDSNINNNNKTNYNLNAEIFSKDENEYADIDEGINFSNPNKWQQLKFPILTNNPLNPKNADGIELVRSFFFRNFKEYVDNVIKNKSKIINFGSCGGVDKNLNYNWKGLLQTYHQKNNIPIPEYEKKAVTGPDHQRTFSVSVKFLKKKIPTEYNDDDKKLDQEKIRRKIKKCDIEWEVDTEEGVGNTIKNAEQAAAAAAFKKIEKIEEELDNI